MNDLQYRSDVALYGIDIRRFSYAVPFNLFRGRFFKFRIPQYNFCNLFIGGERPARLLDIPLDHFSRILYSLAFKGLFAGINFGAQRNFLPALIFDAVYDDITDKIRGRYFCLQHLGIDVFAVAENN